MAVTSQPLLLEGKSLALQGSNFEPLQSEFGQVPQSAAFPAPQQSPGPGEQLVQFKLWLGQTY